MDILHNNYLRKRTTPGGNFIYSQAHEHHAALSGNLRNLRKLMLGGFRNIVHLFWKKTHLLVHRFELTLSRGANL